MGNLPFLIWIDLLPIVKLHLTNLTNLLNYLTCLQGKIQLKLNQDLSLVVWAHHVILTWFAFNSFSTTIPHFQLTVTKWFLGWITSHWLLYENEHKGHCLSGNSLEIDIFCFTFVGALLNLNFHDLSKSKEQRLSPN